MNNQSGIVTDALTGRAGQTAIIDFYHCESSDFRIVPAVGWTLHKTNHLEPLTIVRFRRIVTGHESSSCWTFNRPAEVAYDVDYL
jgi:hypothetical protein